MNRRLVGYTLLFGIIYFYFKHNEKTKLEDVEKKEETKKVSIEKNIEKKNVFEIPQEDEKIKGEKKEFSLENDEIKIVFSNIGARIVSVELKNYKNYQKKNVTLLTPESSSIFFMIERKDKTKINTKDLLFNNVKIEKNKIEFEYVSSNNEKITSIFELNEKKPFVLRHKFNFPNFNDCNKMYMSIINLLQRQETNIDDCRNRSTVKFMEQSGNVNGFNESLQKEEMQNKQDLKWISWKQKFFTSGLSLKDNKNNTEIYVAPGEKNIIKNTCLNIEFIDFKGDINLDFYFGPNKINTLNTFTDKFDQNIYYGMPGVRIFNRYILLPITNYMYLKNINVAIIIFLLVLLLKLLLFPLNFKSYKMMAKMKVLTPLLKSLNEKYKDDKEKLAFEQLRLYKEYGVNPLSSILPLFLQFPFLIAMFNFIPISFVFREKSFLWCKDMSTFDSIMNFGFNIPFYGDHLSLFALLMTLTTVLYTLYSNKSSGMSKNSLIMMIFFPLFFLGISNRFCGALNLYYLIFNIITLIVQHFMKYFINEEDITNKMQISIASINKSDKNFSKQFIN